MLPTNEVNPFSVIPLSMLPRAQAHLGILSGSQGARNCVFEVFPWSLRRDYRQKSHEAPGHEAAIDPRWLPNRTICPSLVKTRTCTDSFSFLIFIKVKSSQKKPRFQSYWVVLLYFFVDQQSTGFIATPTRKFVAIVISLLVCVQCPFSFFFQTFTFRLVTVFLSVKHWTGEAHDTTCNEQKKDNSIKIHGISKTNLKQGAHIH